MVSLYHSIRVKIEKYNDKEEYKDILGVLNRSLIIISRITEKMPICLDSHYCEKFIKTFDFHINLLCTYYHSLCHFELISKFMFNWGKELILEKEKIVEGINKMYTIHLKIKDLYKHNTDIINALSLITDYKRIFSNKIDSVQAKSGQARQSQDHFADNFEAQAVEFYEGLLEKVKAVG